MSDKNKPTKPEPPITSEIKLTESKIKKLLDFEHLEELFYLVNILNDKQVNSFIEHYKKSNDKTKDRKIDNIIKNSTKKYDLINSLKKLLMDSLKDEYLSIRDKISTHRKKGGDTFIEDIKSMSVPLKIKLFGATANKQDFYKIKKELDNLKNILELKHKELLSSQQQKSENKTPKETKKESQEAKSETKTK